MSNIIACRPGCYDLPLNEAFAELKKIGIDYVEVNLPADDDYAPMVVAAEKAGVKISSLGAGLDISSPEQKTKLEKAIAAAEEH